MPFVCIHVDDSGHSGWRWVHCSLCCSALAVVLMQGQGVEVVVCTHATRSDRTVHAHLRIDGEGKATPIFTHTHQQSDVGVAMGKYIQIK